MARVRGGAHHGMQGDLPQLGALIQEDAHDCDRQWEPNGDVSPA